MLVFKKLPAAEQTPTKTHEYSHIECDVCEKRAPGTEELIARHGLSNCGWFVGAGQHRCAEHYTTDAPARGPQYRDQ